MPAQDFPAIFAELKGILQPFEPRLVLTRLALQRLEAEEQ